jgi:hypothetical protein
MAHEHPHVLSLRDSGGAKHGNPHQARQQQISDFHVFSRSCGG